MLVDRMEAVDNAAPPTAAVNKGPAGKGKEKEEAEKEREREKDRERERAAAAAAKAQLIAQVTRSRGLYEWLHGACGKFLMFIMSHALLWCLG